VTLLPRTLGERDRAVLRVLGVTLALNWMVAAGKLAAGVVAGNITVIADALHAFLDGGNNVLAGFAIVWSAKPPDDDHPYGHRKFENVAAMAIGGMIVLIAWEVMDNVVRTTWAHLTGSAEHVAHPLPAPWQFAVVVAALAVNLATSFYERRAGKRLGSALLTADAAHTQSDALATGLSIVSLGASGVAWWIDPLLAIGVLALLLRAALGIIRENLPAFTDHRFLDPREVARVAGGVEGVLGTRRIRSHGTATDVHVDLEIVVDPNITAEDAEAIEAAVRAALRARYANASLIGIRHRTASPEWTDEA